MSISEHCGCCRRQASSVAGAVDRNRASFSRKSFRSVGERPDRTAPSRTNFVVASANLHERDSGGRNSGHLWSSFKPQSMSSARHVWAESSFFQWDETKTLQKMIGEFNPRSHLFTWLHGVQHLPPVCHEALQGEVGLENLCISSHSNNKVSGLKQILLMKLLIS